MQKHHASKCDFPGRNTTAFIPHTHLLQTISAHTSTAHCACSVLAQPLTNSGSMSPSTTSRRHQATTHVVGLPHARQPHQRWPPSCHSFKTLDTLKKKKRANCIQIFHLEKAVYYENLSPTQKFYVERFLLLSPLLSVFLLQKPSELQVQDLVYHRYA